MKDIFDYADNVVLHEDEGRQGLAELARYQNARSREGDYIPEQALAYFDLLADVFLTAAKGKTGDMQAVIKDPRLGLVYPASGRPKKQASSANYIEISKKRAFKAAVYRAELIRDGLPAGEADDETLQRFNYKDISTLNKARKLYKELVEYELDIRLLRRVYQDSYDK